MCPLKNTSSLFVWLMEEEVLKFTDAVNIQLCLELSIAMHKKMQNIPFENIMHSNDPFET